MKKKCRKIGHFAKGNGFGHNYEISYFFLFRYNTPKKNQKIGIFSKGLAHGFGQNYEIS